MFGKGSKTPSPERSRSSRQGGEEMMWSRSRSRQIPTSRGRRRYEGGSGGRVFAYSCPAKPVIGSMPEPGMKDSVPPLTLPPTPSSSFDSQQATFSSSMSRSLFSGQTNFGNMAMSCPVRNPTWNIRKSITPTSSGTPSPQGTPKDEVTATSSSNSQSSTTVLSMMEAHSLEIKSKLATLKRERLVRRRSSSMDGENTTDPMEEQDTDSQPDVFGGVFQLDDEDCKPCGW